MDRDKLNVINLYNYFHKIFYGDDKLSKHIFTTNYPPSNPSGTDFYVVVMIRPVTDMNGFGRCTTLVHLVSTDKQVGISSSAIIGKMESKLNEIVEEEYTSNNEISIRRRSTYPYYNVSLNTHATVVELTTIIK